MLSSLTDTHINGKLYLREAMSHYCTFALLVAASSVKRTHHDYISGDREIDAIADRIRQRERQCALKREELRKARLDDLC